MKTKEFDKSKVAQIPARIGFGEDSHHTGQADPSSRAKPMKLGGVLVEGNRKDYNIRGYLYSPDSNTDGDAVIHAIFNSVSSALGDYPVGHYFKGIMESSRPILDAAVQMLNSSPYVLMNMVIAIEGQRPRIVPLIPQMQNNLSIAFHVNRDMIGITATSGEDLTSFGKGEGIRVTVTIMLMEKGIYEGLMKTIEFRKETKSCDGMKDDERDNTIPNERNYQ